IDGGLAKRFILELLWEIAVAVSAESHSENSDEYSNAEQPRPALEYSHRDSTTNKPSIDRNTQTQKESQKQWAGSTNVQNDIEYELVGDEPGARQSMTPHAARSGVTPFSKGQVATEPWQQVPISSRYNTWYPTALDSCEQEFTPIGHSYTPQGAYNNSSLRSRLLFQDGEGEGDGDRLGQDEDIYGRSVWAGVLDRDIDDERGVRGVLPAGERAFYRTSSEQIGARGGYDHHSYNYQSMSHYRAGADGNVESLIDGGIGHVDNDLGLDMARLRLGSAHEMINTDVDTRLHTLPRSRFSTHTRSGAYATPYQTTHGETADAEPQLPAENRLGYNQMNRLRGDLTASNNEYHHQRNANRFRYNTYNGHLGMASTTNLLQLYGDGYEYGHEHDDRNLQSRDDLYENQFAATQRRLQQQQARDMQSAMQSMRLDGVNQHRGEKEPVDTGIYGPGLDGFQQIGDEDYDARYSGSNSKPRVDTKRTDDDGYESGISHREEAEHLRREIKRMQENIACLGESRQAA
ncbi:hypothetical protein SARC_09390, partial [Sphaeroforma arctica JP610]